MKNRCHPSGVTPGKIVVDCHQMNTLTGQTMEIQSGDCRERFSFTCFLFGDFSVSKNRCCHQLYIKMSKSKCSSRCFTNQCKCFRENTVERLTFFYALSKF